MRNARRGLGSGLRHDAFGRFPDGAFRVHTDRKGLVVPLGLWRLRLAPRVGSRLGRPGLGLARRLGAWLGLPWRLGLARRVRLAPLVSKPKLAPMAISREPASMLSTPVAEAIRRRPCFRGASPLAG